MGNVGLVEPTDAQLLAVSRFDSVHFTPIVERHAIGVHGYPERRLGRVAADANLVDAFVAAYGVRRRFREWNGSARPWLLGVATGIACKHWRIELTQLRTNEVRRRQPFGATVASVPSAVAPVAAAVIDRLRHLPARDRDLAILVAWEGLDHEMVARSLDLPDSVVASRLAGIGAQVLVDTRAELVGHDVELPDDGLDMVQALCPVVAPPDAAVVDAVSGELRELTGQLARVGSVRSTVSVAAEHEQHRRWLARPGVLRPARSRR